MSSQGERSRSTYEVREVGHSGTVLEWFNGGLKLPTTSSTVETGKQFTVSESHPRSRDGSYREGGPFLTSRVTNFVKSGHMKDAYSSSNGEIYTGPVSGQPPSIAEKEALGYKNIPGNFGDLNESSLNVDGTNAISRCNPINPASNLGTSLAESVREGIPTLPGIKLWRDKTKFLRGLGSEYLNYQFGWAPLQNEVHSVVSAARTHRDLLQQYHRGEGSDTHRTYRFPSDRTSTSLELEHPDSWSGLPFRVITGGSRQVFLVRETKKWFEGVFTYGLPSSTDSWRKALGYGSDADHLFGLALTPDVLWELTPWSWAIDWFSNAGEVINNVTAFGLAGLVLRYGYMMEESIERIFASGTGPSLPVVTLNKQTEGINLSEPVSAGSYQCGVETVTKRRVPASPFGFSVGWEGLSPTQLAITAALGITRLL